MNQIKPIGLSIVAIGVVSVLPFLVDPETTYVIYLLFLSFLYIALSQGWNLLGGFTGQLSLGTHAFFGLGAYVTAITWKEGVTNYFDPLAMLLSGLAAVVLAVAVGLPLLSKLRGDYFALGTLGLGEILRTVFIQGGAFTGGSEGIVISSANYSSIVPYYFTALMVAVLATIGVRLIIKSRVGLAMISIREDEEAAQFNGINILTYKVLAFAIGAFIAGVCGSIQAYFIFHIYPLGFFNLNWTLYPILMCLFGGAGTILGPIIGALCLTGVFELTKVWLVEIHPIFSGVLIIVVVIFMPDGITRLKSTKTRIGKSGLFVNIRRFLTR